MATVPTSVVLGNPAYPTTDGKPMAETDQHRELMNELIQTLKTHYADAPRTYVSGNLLLFYEPGNKRKHISPDVLVVKGVAKGDRLNYLVWEEGKAPNLVIELTSSSTRAEDTKKKFALYQDRLKVSEYFLFDPLGDYLKPPMQGYRLRRGQYAPIRAVHGRLPSRVLRLHLERYEETLRLYDPDTERWLPTAQEALAQAETARQREAQARQQAETARQQEAQARHQAEAAQHQAEAAQHQAEAAQHQAEAARHQESRARERAEAEAERLRRELEALRRGSPQGP